ncbi:ferric reductase-like transmembrane domain-containing protein [Frankia tisae]|uniref:ferric reductase-like transmembrane domain-containing protein n=1 Tax=Frankia tisae TaxID=2950104 RepID=UPI0021BF3A00|nr:ferric reductase-like transmembrane domain-containing protein [Frankia tisae]
MTTNTLWYVARGSGTVALLLLTVTVSLGVLARSGRGLAGLPGFAVAAVHRSASLLAVGFVALHVVTLSLDPYAQLTLPDIIIPFGAGYRPLWVGLGTVALDLLAAIVLTSLLRRHLGARTWRTVHWAAYAAWPVAFAHALGAGSDTSTTWLRAVAVTCAFAVAGAVTWRLSAGFAASRQPVGLAPPPPLPVTVNDSPVRAMRTIPTGGSRPERATRAAATVTPPAQTIPGAAGHPEAAADRSDPR